MAIAAASGDIDRGRAIGAAYIKSRASALLALLVSLWVFSGGFVMSEPAPYELVFLAVLGVGVFGGWTLHRNTAQLLVLFVGFVPFALIGAFQVKFMDLTDSLIFVAVTIFLFFTAFFIANYVAEGPHERMQQVSKALIASAVITALLGIGGYLGLIPGGEALFTRYLRAKGAFQDPNVFAPYLILPAMYLLQRILLADNLKQTIWPAGLFMILLIGVFVSFSRAAWGTMAISAIAVFFLVFFLEAKARERFRMMVLAICGALAIVVAIGGLLSIPSVQELFDIRATDQAYDEGESGRFGRQGYALDLALNNPWGLGPLEFSKLRIVEEPHNSYVTTLHAYGWGGGFFFTMLILITSWRGLKGLARPSSNRLLLIPLTATFVPLAVEAAIIDIDHWRHLYLIAGLIWGVTASFPKLAPGAARPAPV